MPSDVATREIFGNVGSMSRGVFYLLATLALVACSWGVLLRYRRWRRGRSDRQTGGLHPASKFDLIGHVLQHLLLFVRVRRGRKWAGWMHSLLVYGMGLLFLGTLLIAVEHYAGPWFRSDASSPWFHKGWYFAVYEVVLDAAGIAVVLSCLWFMWRHSRGRSSAESGLMNWCLLLSLLLISLSGFVVEGLRLIREQPAWPGVSFVGWLCSRGLLALGVSEPAADRLHWYLWWTHSVLALAVIAALPYTRLLHFLAGAIAITRRSAPLGALPLVTLDEVENTGVYGVSRIDQFERRQLVQLDACVSCGRCEDVCPAFEAGKPLSPRGVVQDLRSEFAALSPVPWSSIRQTPDGSDDALPPLREAAVSSETLWSCTACSACVAACPLGVDPLTMIIDLRRGVVGEGELRGGAATTLQKLQRSGNPWGLPREKRCDWAEGLDVPTVETCPDFEVLYWVGCAASYDRRLQRVARCVVQLLQASGVRFAVLGSQETCTGETARRMGDEFVFQQLAETNAHTLDEHQVRKIVTHCPHCFNSFRSDYPQLGCRVEVQHHSQFLSELLADGRIRIRESSRAGDDIQRLVYHDPCYLARAHDVVEAPRDILQHTQQTYQLVDLRRSGTDTACCGAGGGRMWLDDSIDQRVGRSRVDEVLSHQAEVVAVSCPFCLTMLTDGLAAEGAETEVLDIAELLVSVLDVE